MTEAPIVVVPSEAELQQRLSATHGIEERVRYVLSLLRPVEAWARAVENLQAEIERRDRTIEGQATELRSLRAQLGEMPENERARAKDRADMLTKLNRARSIQTQVKQQVNAALALMDEALKR